MNLEKLNQRNSALDIIRIVAVFSVVSVHFFLHTNFYAVALQGPLMFFMCTFRTFFNVCVPLFIILTGYLMCQKKLSKKYYSGLAKTIVVYVLIAITCIIFKAVHLKETVTFKSALIDILDFSGANYSWYIEMYIGLFLIAPFLNLIYNNLKNQKQKQVLVFTFTALTILPSLFNIFNFDSAEWWVNPSNESFAAIFNDWWKGSYPIAYYFVGCYFREYGMKIKTKSLALSLIGFTFLFGAFNFYRCHGSGYQSSLYGLWNGFEAFVLSALLFELLSRIKTDKYPARVKWCLWKLSDLALGIYLLSYIFDTLLYPYLTKKVATIQDRFPFYFIMVPLVFILSAIASAMINQITDAVLSGYKKLKAFIVAQREKNNAKLWQDILFATLLLGTLVFSFWKCVYGFGGNDEAFYLTIPHRLTLGDAFIRDEWNLTQLSGFLLYPFVKIYTAVVGSTEGIMLGARIMYVIFHCCTSIVIYIRLRRYGIMSVFASVLYFMFTPYNIMAYSYNTMGLEFVTLTGVILGTAGYERPLPVIVSGMTLACAVLCCPYLAIAYVVYGIGVVIHYLIKNRKFKCVFSIKMFELKTFLWFTAGVSIVAVIFIIFALSRASLSEIFESLSPMLSNPYSTKPSTSDKITSYFNSFYTFQKYFKYPLMFYGGLLAVMLLDRKRKQHRSLYLLGTIAIVIITYIIIFPQLTSKYFNAIMMPMIFIGITSYILCKKKPRKLLASLFALGVIYSFAINLGSNQYHYAICMALSASNIASYIFLGRLIQEMRKTKDSLDYAVCLKYCSFAMIAFMLVLQSGFQINAKAGHVFWDAGTKSLTAKISSGPAKGIYTTPDKYAEYQQIYGDLQSYKDKERDTILCLTNKSWVYLALNDFEYGTRSAWISGEDDNNIKRFATYFATNPEKKPRYVYIPKNSSWDLQNIYDEAHSAGYNVEENAISYKLERIE